MVLRGETPGMVAGWRAGIEVAPAEEVGIMAREMTLAVHPPIRAARSVPSPRMTEDEFAAWVPEEVRAEWVDGRVTIMPPDSDEHSQLGLWLGTLLHLFVERHDLGVVRGPQLTVRLGRPRQRRLPDLLFVARARSHVVHPNHVEGSPDLIMEIVSSESAARDWREKYLAYEAAGVREYWVIDPLSRRIEAYRLGSTRRYQTISERDGRIESHVLPGFALRAQWLFGPSRAKVMTALKELGVVG